MINIHNGSVRNTKGMATVYLKENSILNEYVMSQFTMVIGNSIKDMAMVQHIMKMVLMKASGNTIVGMG